MDAAGGPDMSVVVMSAGHGRGVEGLRAALGLMAARRVVEDEIERLIALLDAMDAEGGDRVPDDEDEVTCEDEGVVVALRQVGRQFGSHTG